MDDRPTANDALKQFVEAYAGQRIDSTGYSKVPNVALPIYNVIGSTTDPKIPGFPTWKDLLDHNGFAGNKCFVTGAADRSHPGFDVGGHMTHQADGSVLKGICYLMPLCKLHNGKGFEKQPFKSLTSTTMLQLTGYKPKDVAATFLARLAGDAPVALVFRSGEGLDYRALNDARADTREKLFEDVADSRGNDLPQHYVMLKRMPDGDRPTYEIVDHNVD